MTSEQAGEVISRALDQLKSFPGFIAHASGAIPGSHQVSEVWESQEAHERWVQEVIAPTLRQVGMQQPLPPAQYTLLDRVITR